MPKYPHQDLPERISKFVVKQVQNTLEIDCNNEWKLGFLIAYNVQKFIIKQNSSEFSRPDQIKKINPWDFEQSIVLVYEGINGVDDYTLEKNFDDIMDDFVLCWEKVSCSNPVITSFNTASKEFIGSDRTTAFKRSQINVMIVKRMCEILSIESDVFFIPTRELGSLLGQNRNYASNKINKLINEGILIKVNDGNRRMSPHYKLNKNVKRPMFDDFVT